MTFSNLNKTSKVIKKISLENIDSNETKYLNREAELLSRIEHDHVLAFHESFFEGRNYFIVTEYCEGGDLKDFLKSKKNEGFQLEEKLIIEMTAQLLSGLDCVHSHGIIHRDLKTRNVFLRKINNDVNKIHLVIGDFGISKAILETNSVSSANLFKGTINYSSPERFSGICDYKCDIWALGCILYEMCTFELAFSADFEPQVIFKIIEHKVPKLPSSYSKELSLIFEKY